MQPLQLVQPLRLVVLLWAGFRPLMLSLSLLLTLPIKQTDKKSKFTVPSFASPGYDCIFLLTAAPSTGRVYSDIGWSNLYCGIYPWPCIKPRDIWRAQPIGNLCYRTHRISIQGCSPLSRKNSEIWFSFVVYLLLFSFQYQGTSSMATSIHGVSSEDLIIQSPIGIWSLFPLF